MLTGNKFSQVVRLIYDNIDKTITLEDIAEQAGLSLASLKRLFQEAVEQSPGAFIRRLRMELAFQSLRSRENSILEVALASGFDDHSAFTRSFKESFGYTPSEARKKINIMAELECVELAEPDFIELNQLQLFAVTEKGSYFQSAPNAWNKLRGQLTDAEKSDDFSGIFVGISHDNPHENAIAENQMRFSACVTHLASNHGLEKITIPAGKYARFRYQGKPNNHGLAYHYIFGKWATVTNQKIDHSRLTLNMCDNFPTALKTQKTMIYVPIV